MMSLPQKKIINLGDPDLDPFIDSMIEKWENSGRQYDQCKKAMQVALDASKRPLEFSEWIEASKKDKRGRHKYDDSLFDAESVKCVILDLVKSKRVYRLGRQTFFSHIVISKMEEAISNVMFLNCCICTFEEIAELLLDYQADKVIKNFVEEQIVKAAMDNIECLHKIGNEYIHEDVISAICSYCREALTGRWDYSKPMTKADFFDYIRRVNCNSIESMDSGMVVTSIKECLTHPAVQKLILKSLVKEKVVHVKDGFVSPPEKYNQYSILED
jgi:hypothetical protein